MIGVFVLAIVCLILKFGVACVGIIIIPMHKLSLTTLQLSTEFHQLILMLILCPILHVLMVTLAFVHGQRQRCGQSPSIQRVQWLFGTKICRAVTGMVWLSLVVVMVLIPPVLLGPMAINIPCLPHDVAGTAVVRSEFSKVKCKDPAMSFIHGEASVRCHIVMGKAVSIREDDGDTKFPECICLSGEVHNGKCLGRAFTE